MSSTRNESRQQEDDELINTFLQIIIALLTHSISYSFRFQFPRLLPPNGASKLVSE